MDEGLRCPTCGYDLRGLEGRAEMCPECGLAPRWRDAEQGFRGWWLAWLAGTLACASLPIVAAAAYWNPEWRLPSLFPWAFVWSWAWLVVCLSAGYWRSGRFAAVAHGIIVGGVCAAIWASVCFLVIERLAAHL